eukprot:1157744-Pelagomonas_calceolata.AAC.1
MAPLRCAPSIALLRYAPSMALTRCAPNMTLVEGSSFALSLLALCMACCSQIVGMWTRNPLESFFGIYYGISIYLLFSDGRLMGRTPVAKDNAASKKILYNDGYKTALK